ncbi:unnamed protein product [Adineta ricciae]|uniref:NAD(P)(+)--arginine ADP-ribosyltransferase n=1 Tax=Adineta ricciae TaxID=249248 RepID=A0A813UXH9_ADIRI|nr:unnamed protein product [Adineta ricciae]
MGGSNRKPKPQTYQTFFEYLLSPNGIVEIPIVTLEQAVTPLIPLLPNIRTYVRLAKDKCNNPSDGLTPNESASIMLYTMGWQPYDQCLYMVLNRTIRSKNCAKLQPWLLYLKLFLTALTRLPSNQMTVYRENNFDLGQQYELNEKFVWWDFALCSVSSEQISLAETKTRFSINCRSVKNIHKHTYFPSDSSVLILPGTKFQVVERIQQTDDINLITLQEIQSSFLLTTQTFHKKSQTLFQKYCLPKSRSNRLFSMRKPSSASVTFRQVTLRELINAFDDDWINLSEQNINDRDMKFVVQKTIANKRYKRVRLANNHITAQGALTLGKSLQNNNTLQFLDLRNNSIGDLGMQILLPQIIRSNLKILKLESNGITSEGAQYLAELVRCNRTLTELYLSQNRLGDVGVELLTNALNEDKRAHADHDNKDVAPKPSTLQHLYLGDNDITDIGIGYLANMLKSNRTLTWLWLSNNQITNPGLQILSSVLINDNFTLQWLFLNSNKGIDDGSLDTFASLFKYNLSLKTIYLYDCNLSDAVKQTLHRLTRYKRDFDLEV